MEPSGFNVKLNDIWFTICAGRHLPFIQTIIFLFIHHPPAIEKKPVWFVFLRFRSGPVVIKLVLAGNPEIEVLPESHFQHDRPYLG